MKDQTVLSGLGFDVVASQGGVVEYRLKSNGLKVLFVENHSAPVVTAMIVYRVGSRNEAVGYTGSTHFLEHMMFKGTTDRHPSKGNGIDDLLKPIGALYNATTSYDRTNYYEVVAKEHLELVLAIEADRMRNLVLTREDRNSEMTVVRNEFERGENDPSDVMYKELMAMSFREHPYHHPVIGWRSDVEGVPMERMQQFYDTFYFPNNATLIVAGDLDPEATLALVAKLFGAIAPSPREIPAVYTTEPKQEGERTFTIRRKGNEMPEIWMGFHVPQAAHGDTYALSVAAALLGSSGKRASRLYKALVDTGLAVKCFAQAGQNRDPGLFIVQATCAPGVEPRTLEAAIHAELEGLVSRSADERDLKRVKQANRKATLLKHDDSSDFAELLCDGESVADWKWALGYDDHFDAVTADDVTRVAAQYLNADNRTTGYFQPIAEAESGEDAVVETATTGGVESAVFGSAESATYAERVRKHVLPNGLTVLALATPGETVSVATALRAGSAASTYDKALIPELVSYMLTKGSAQLGKAELAEQLEGMGTSIGFRTGPFTVGSRATVVSDDLVDYLALFGNVLRNPLFAQVELDRSLKEFEAFVMQNSSDTESVASARLSQELYDKSVVYHDKPYDELLAELRGITRDDLVKFHAENYSPSGLVLAICGAIDADKVLEILPASLTEWQGAAAKPIAVSAVEVPAKAARIDVPIAGKASTDIVIGLPASVKRTDPDYFAASLANAALGADTLSSRLGLEVRERNGLTYGITCSFENLTAGFAPWKITLSVNPDNIDKAIALVRKVVDDYRANGITERELADEKGRAYGSFVVSLRSTAGLASALVNLEVYGLGAAEIDGLKAKYDAVTKEEVDAAIRKYFDLVRAVTVVAGSIEAAQ